MPTKPIRTIVSLGLICWIAVAFEGNGKNTYPGILNTQHVVTVSHIQRVWPHTSPFKDVTYVQWPGNNKSGYASSVVIEPSYEELVALIQQCPHQS